MGDGGGLDDVQSQAFWNDFMRRPEAKAAYQAERRLQEKKKAWLEEREAIDERARRRKVLADELEGASAEMKKLIAPIFHIRMVEHFIWMVYDECQNKKTNFQDKLSSEGTLAHLKKLRESFQEGGEEAMQKIEDQWLEVCYAVHEDEEKKKVEKPMNCDIQTLKQVLEFGQECRREGNDKFKEGLYEEALFIYGQGDEVMSKWKVEKHLKNEHKWLQDYHLACLKNKAQAALKLEQWSVALEASEKAIKMDEEDHKAWYRKVHALKGMGRFLDAEDALGKLEDIAQWHPNRRTILRDCEAERQRIRVARHKHKVGTQNMLSKTLEAGVFSADRELEDDDYAPEEQTAPAPVEEPKKVTAPPRPLERNIQLTAALAGDLIDELAKEYGKRPFQERVRKCARDSGYERAVFLMRLKDIAFEVQKPILQKWGFDGDEHGVREMTAAIRDHAGPSMPDWLREKQQSCLRKLYGGEEGGMLDVLDAG